MGDEFWLEPSGSTATTALTTAAVRAPSRSQHDTPISEQPQNQVSRRPRQVRDDDDGEAEGSFRFRSRSQRTQDPKEAANDSDALSVTQAESTSVPVRTSTRATRGRTSREASVESQVSTRAKGKRGASPAVGERQSKRREIVEESFTSSRSRQMERVIEDSEGEEEGRFRFRRRR